VIIREVETTKEEVMLTRKGKPVAVVAPFNEAGYELRKKGGEYGKSKGPLQAKGESLLVDTLSRPVWGYAL
jgi:prevent-host-death family protein